MPFFWTFYSSKIPDNDSQNTKQKTIAFNIANNQKCFLSSKSAYYSDFWRSCDTEDWRNDAENSALIKGVNSILQYIHIENTYFKW